MNGQGRALYSVQCCNSALIKWCLMMSDQCSGKYRSEMPLFIIPHFWRKKSKTSLKVVPKFKLMSRNTSIK
ncbi:hypothetical protein J6590_068516 [Homalodisca vitripennis]|nr:hypothetical protein J6590_068513 [Homalodisca vitripennis]KAG8291124.1 hypothetical protein J6590_068516 [Homalodisca vitripennis]